MAYYGSHIMAGGIEVVCGPMFSGKTEELIRRVRRAQIAKQKVQIFKPSIDNRYHESAVVSHSEHSISAAPVKDSFELLTKVYDSTRVIAIDEVQFFDEGIISIISKLAKRGCRVICAGLDQDYKGRPFGPMAELLCIADRVDKVQAICTVCGAPASKTYRYQADTDQQIVVGEAEMYQARCRNHVEYYDEEEDFQLSFLAYQRESEHTYKAQRVSVRKDEE
jgi:thymidine kinase